MACHKMGHSYDYDHIGGLNEMKEQIGEKTRMSEDKARIEFSSSDYNDAMLRMWHMGMDVGISVQMKDHGEDQSAAWHVFHLEPEQIVLLRHFLLGNMKK